MTVTGRPENDRSTGRLTHIDEHGHAHMVDVTGKPPTRRAAEARCSVRTTADVTALLVELPGDIDLVEAARFSGIQAAKKTSSLIPLCHPIRLDGVTVDVEVATDGFRIVAVTEVIERTGVEMEALTACAAAALTLLQPLLHIDPLTSIEGLTLWRKTGGRSGTWRRSEDGEMSVES